MGNLALSTLALLQGQEVNVGAYNPTAAQIWAWIGAAGFLVGIIGFCIIGFRATPKGRGHFVAKILVVITALSSYIALAFGQGTQAAGESTYFGFARYVDWAVTTPLLLLGLALLAIPRARDALPLVLGLMAVDLYMIVTGLFAGLSNEDRWVWLVWFIISSIAFVVIYAIIFGPLAQRAKHKVEEGEAMKRSNDPVERYLGALHSGEGKWFAPMAAFLGLVWLVYPVNYFLSEQGINVYGHPTSDAIYTISDVTAKVIYGFVLLSGILAIEKRAANAMGRDPKEMGDEEKTRFHTELADREGEYARHKAARLRGGSREEASERSPSRTSGSGASSRSGETIYEADSEGVHLDRYEDQDVQVRRKRRDDQRRDR